MVSTACAREAEIVRLQDRLSCVAERRATWEQVRRFVHSMPCDDGAFNMHCAEEAPRELDACNLDMKTVEGAAQQLFYVRSCAAR